MRKNLEVAPIRIDAEDSPFIWVGVVHPFLRGDVESLVSLRPVNAPVRTDRRPMHVVTTETNVDAVTV